MARAHTAFQATLTQAEKDAAVKARVVDGLSGDEVARRAARGELEGAGKFTITASYVRILSNRATADHSPARLAKPGQAEQAIDKVRYGVLALILRDWERLQTRAKRADLDLPKAGRILRAMHDWQRTESTRTQDAETEHENDQDTETQDTAQVLLAQLAGLAKQQPKDRTNGRDDTASLSTRVSPGNNAKP